MKRFAAALLIGLLCCGCNPSPDDTGSDDQKTGGQQQKIETVETASEKVKTKLTINTEHAREATINRTLKVTGSFSADQTVNLAPQVSGRVVKVNARLGDYVRKDEVLIELDKTDILLDINLKEANLKQQLAILGMTDASQSLPPKDELPNVKKAKVNMENCLISYNRKLKEREQDLIADQDVDDAQTAYKSAKADYENQLFYADRDYASVLTAKSELDISKQNYIYTDVKSPIDGIVQEQKIYEGDYIQQASPGLVLVSTSPLLLDVNIPQKYAGLFPLGKTLEIQSDAATSKKFTGIITYISPVSDATVRAVPVRAKVENPTKELKPGMFSDINLVYARESVIAVPQISVVEYKGISKVYVINGGKVREVIVDKGTSIGSWIEVTPRKSGDLRNGDVVAVSGAAGLEEGVEVDIEKSGDAYPPKS